MKPSAAPASLSVCVYCASSPHIDRRYQETARATGALAAAQGWNIVYGGSARGLMGIMANAALEGGAQVTGVIPEYLKSKEVAHTGLTTLHVTQTMHERQMKMADLADAFVVLPGGLGTLAEFFEIITWKQLKLHAKPVILVNAHNYWDPLLQMIDHALHERFLHEEAKMLFQIATDISQLPLLLKNA